MTPRDVIRETLLSLDLLNAKAAERYAGIIATDLSNAGYSIVKTEELERVRSIVERAASGEWSDAGHTALREAAQIALKGAKP